MQKKRDASKGEQNFRAKNGPEREGEGQIVRDREDKGYCRAHAQKAREPRSRPGGEPITQEPRPRKEPAQVRARRQRFAL